MYINCKGKLIDLSRPKIMGILNLTPNSFYDGGKHNSIKNALFQVEKMWLEGADFIDIGGSSTKPDAKKIEQDHELKRIMPTLVEITKEFPEAIVSVDTFYAKVAVESIHAGASLINDVSGGSMDEKMFETVSNLQVPYVLSHLKGDLFNRPKNPTYENLLIEMNFYFSEKIKQLKQLNLNDIILDPGFGFSKTLFQNYSLLKQLDLLSIHNLPLLVGVSRKSMLYKKFDIKPAESLSATSAAHMAAMMNGANILRVHDVREAKQVVEIYRAIC
jgi:dihydropteroate synthase